MAVSNCSSTTYFGWDLLMNSVQKDIRNKEDILVLVIHWSLCKAGFRCVGVGESMDLDENDLERASELLPEGWNCTNNYALRYVYNDNKLYNIALTRTSENELVNINIIHKNNNVGMAVKLNETIGSSLCGPITKILINCNSFLCQIQNELINKLLEEKSSSSTQTDRPEPTTQTIPQRRSFEHPSHFNSWEPDPLADPRQIGRADLDPFASGGGMIFRPPRINPGAIPPLAPSRPSGIGPFGPGGLPFQPPPNYPGVPPGSVPPGARFDPFRPDGIDPVPPPRRRPDTDHMPPPGYDDMFM